jgi:hypothetical protein
VVLIKKLNQFGLTTSIREDIHHKSGELSILIRLLLKQRAEINTTASEETKNSILDPSSQCKELSNVLVLIMPLSRDGIITERPRDGSSTQSLRQSETETGLLILFLRKEQTLDADP